MRFVLTTLLAGSLLLSGAEIPRPASSLTWKGANGEALDLAKYKGKVVILEIMSTTCPHCQNSSRILSKLYTELAPRGFQVLGYAINPDANVPDFIRNFGVTFPVGKGVHDTALTFLQHPVMKSFYVPQLVIIDREGMVQGQYGGGDPFFGPNEEQNIRGIVEKLLASGKQPVSAAPKAKRKVS